MDLRAYALFHCPFDDRRSAYMALTQSVAAGEMTVDVEAAPLREVEEVWGRQSQGEARRKLVLVPEA